MIGYKMDYLKIVELNFVHPSEAFLNKNKKC